MKSKKMRQYSKNLTSHPNICFKQLNLLVFNHLILKVINIPCLRKHNKLDLLFIQMIVKYNSFKKMMVQQHLKTRTFQI